MTEPSCFTALKLNHDALQSMSVQQECDRRREERAFKARGRARAKRRSQERTRVRLEEG